MIKSELPSLNEAFGPYWGYSGFQHKRRKVMNLKEKLKLLQKEMDMIPDEHVDVQVCWVKMQALVKILIAENR